MTVKPPKRTRALMQTRVLVFAAPLLAFTVYLSVTRSPYYLAFTVETALISAFLVFFYIPRFTESAEIILSKQGVVCKYGVFIKSEHIMPSLRLIFTETRQTPLAGAFSLCSVTFSGAKVKIKTPEIALCDAQSIIAYIKKEGAKEV